jgi:hypothetical protein
LGPVCATEKALTIAVNADSIDRKTNLPLMLRPLLCAITSIIVFYLAFGSAPDSSRCGAFHQQLAAAQNPVGNRYRADVALRREI